MVVDYSQTINKFTLLDAYPIHNIDEQVSEIAKGTVFSTLDLTLSSKDVHFCITYKFTWCSLVEAFIECIAFF